jgi:2-keto-4-pentenoate hydratase/2-oxohepta-3-ene-1,7-dioic acid hydratase in catechol pathway
MRFVTYQAATGAARAAVVRGQELVDLQQSDATLPTCLKAFFAQGATALTKAAQVLKNGPGIARDSVRLLAPILHPQKIFGIGLNYADHAREQGKEPPAEPVIFAKFPTAVRGPGDAIVLPRVSQEVDLEAELVCVIGRAGRNIERNEAHQYVAGYMCGNDVSARDWQQRKPGGQWVLGKSFDSFAPCGPELVTPDEVGDLTKLRIQSRIDGRTMQDSSVSQLIFDIPYLLEYISKICTLTPGDLIFTGTPPGVGMARKPPVWLQPGQTVEIEIDGLGVLHNPVVAE